MMKPEKREILLLGDGWATESVGKRFFGMEVDPYYLFATDIHQLTPILSPVVEHTPASATAAHRIKTAYVD